MTEQHSITPPPELRQLWAQQAQRMDPHDPVAWQQHVAIQAARWGADAELKACCEWVAKCCPYFGDYPMPEEKLRAARRPKPPSLKKQALTVLDDLRAIDATHYNILRNALEQLDD